MSNEAIEFDMSGSPYQYLFNSPKKGMDYADAFADHMTEWLSVLDSESDRSACFYYARLRDLQVDSMDEEGIRIDHLVFPVFFSFDKNEEEGLSENQRNLHSMLVSTQFPLMPAKEIEKTYPFVKVEELESLSWIHFGVVDGRKNLSVEMIESSQYSLIACREKKDGNLFLGVKVGGQNYVIGTFWLSTRMFYDQSEHVPSTNTFFVVKPYLSQGLQEMGYEFDPHPPRPYSNVCSGEGLMVFVANGSTCQEVRVKQENTVELPVKEGNICVAGKKVSPTSVPEGMYECALRSKKLSEEVVSYHWEPVKLRQNKQETRRPEEKVNVFPVVSGLPKRPSVRFDFEYSPDGLEGFVRRKGKWIYSYQWQVVEGLQLGRFFLTSVPKGNSFQWYQTSDYVMISYRVAFVRRLVKTDSPMDPGEQNGVALLSISLGRVGVVLEGGKLYTLPGGKYENGETPHACLERELNEELKFPWTRIQASGPFQSGPCLFYVTTLEILGMSYVDSYHPNLSPHVVRVLRDYGSNPSSSTKCSKVEFFKRTFSPIVRTLQDYLDMGVERRVLVKEFGPQWYLKVPSNSFISVGPLVISCSAVVQTRSWIRMGSVISLHELGVLKQVLPLLPCSQEEMQLASGTSMAFMFDLVSKCHLFREDGKVVVHSHDYELDYDPPLSSIDHREFAKGEGFEQRSVDRVLCVQSAVASGAIKKRKGKCKT